VDFDRASEGSGKKPKVREGSPTNGVTGEPLDEIKRLRRLTLDAALPPKPQPVDASATGIPPRGVRCRGRIYGSTDVRAVVPRRY
jgi:hypothetical protein